MTIIAGMPPLFQDEAWQHIVEQFLQEVPRAAGTKREHRSILARCFCDPGRTPDSYTVEEIEAFASSPGRSPEPIQPGTRRHRLNVLNRFYTYAAQRMPQLGQPATNPAKTLLFALDEQSATDARRKKPGNSDDPFSHLSEAWRKCIGAYLDSVKDHSGSVATYRGYYRILKELFSDPAKTPEQVTVQDIHVMLTRPTRGYRSHGKPLSASAKNLVITAIKNFFIWASNYDVLLPDGTLTQLYRQPLPTRSLKQLKREKKPRAMSESEFEQFCSVIDPYRSVTEARDLACFLCYFWSCRRRIELSRLLVGDLQKTVIVESDGITRREAFTYVYQAKGDSRSRVQAEMPPDAVLALEFYWDVSGRKEAGLQPDDPVFTPVGIGRGRKQATGKEPLSASYIYQRFQVYAERAGLSGVSIHSIRHCAALTRYRSGSSLFEVQTALGHKNPATTFHYLQAMSPSHDTGFKRLQPRFSKLTPRKEHHA